MKPLLLSMQAFGPFAEREVIDFSALGEHPLFLINGPTGAGKTTILDAISYALFGKTTGAERQGEQMRCHHAAQDVATEVDFIFAIGSDVYRVQRMPTQWRPKLRGEGMKEDRATAALWQLTPDTAPAFDLAAEQQKLLASRKVNEVTQQVEQLIGLKADQFRQVVVLPQGKFRELLTADAGQREDIFAQLFQTQRYLLIEEQLKESARELRQQMREHEQQLEALLRDASVDDEQQLMEQREQLKPKLDELEQKKAEHNRAFEKARSERLNAEHLQQQFAERDQLIKEQHALHQKKPIFEAKQEQLRRAHKAQLLVSTSQHMSLLQQQQTKLNQQVNQLQQQQQSLTDDKGDVEKEYQQAQALNQDNQELQRQLEQQQQWLPKLEALQQSEQQQRQLSSEIESKQQQREQLQADTQQRKQHLSRQQQELKALRAEIDQHDNTTAEQHQLELLKQQRARHEALSCQQHEHQAAYEKQQRALNEQLQLTRHAEQRSQQLESQWYEQQAMSLASSLKPGSPCPVCGSREHPRPAHHTEEDLVEHQQVVAARKAFQQQQQKQQQLEQSLSHCQSQLTLTEQQLQDIGQPAATDELKRLADTIHAKISHQQKQRQQLHDLEQNIARTQQELEQLNARHEQLSDDLSDQRMQQQSVSERLKLLQQEIPANFRSAEQLQQSIEQLTQQLHTNQQRQQRATEQWQALSQKLSLVTSQLSDVRQRVEETENQLSELTEKFQQQLHEHGFASHDDYEHARLSNEAYQSLEQELKAFDQQQAGIESRLTNLSQVLSAKQLPDIDALQLQQEQTDEKRQQTEKDWLALRDRWLAMDNVLARVNNSKKQAQQLHKRYAVHGTLADVASGQNAQRLSLHRFVLSVLLDDVLHVASERLEKMTHGRYQLLREQTVSDARTAGGLTILVEDAYTGQQRSTRTLSGGEGFMAALSLALGLSDVVQSYAGGIRLDTLFVDEGFGSLDDDALDMAVDTLAELRASGRTIGIISHVRELKDRLHDRIDVIRERNGSKIVMRTQ